VTQNDVKTALDRVLNWPRERQEDLLEIIATMEGQDTSGYYLSSEQVAEVRRALVDKTEPIITLEELDLRLRRRGL